MGKLISLATMQPVVMPDVPVGQGVRYTGDMANPSGVGAVVAIRDDRNFRYDVALTDGRFFAASMLDKSRFQILPDVLAESDLQILRAAVTAKKALDTANHTAAKESFADAVAKLRGQYNYLVQGYGQVIAAKNIRIELKYAFSGVKFSVRSESYAGGNSIDVSWTDGPNVKQVEKITGKYQGGHFDGMTDCYEYERSPWTEVFGEAKYIFCQREASDALVQSRIRAVSVKYGVKNAPTVADYRSGKIYGIMADGWDMDMLRREINAAISKHTYCIGA